MKRKRTGPGDVSARPDPCVLSRESGGLLAEPGMSVNGPPAAAPPMFFI